MYMYISCRCFLYVSQDQHVRTDLHYFTVKRIKISSSNLHGQRSGSTDTNSLSYLDQFLIRIGSLVNPSVERFVVTHWYRLPRGVIEIIPTDIQILTGHDPARNAVTLLDLDDINEYRPTCLDHSVKISFQQENLSSSIGLCLHCQ